jgi:glycosyltransferase involved in cell wall biosynthesis
MVIGNGAIANRFASYGLQSKYFIFAGSVHNSAIFDTIEIVKEEDAIRAALATVNNSATFIYFSSCSIEDAMQATSPYVAHKMRMEQLIQASISSYLIFRLPQVLGLADIEGGLVHGLVKAIILGERFELWRDATRNFIDLDDVYSIVHAILEEKTHSNRVINIANPCPTPVSELVSLLESYFGKAGNYELIARGEDYPLDTSVIKDVILRLGIDFGPDYLLRVVDKYYAHHLKPALLLSVIVPTYNQALGIDEFYRRAKAVLTRLQPRFNHEMIFVNDFSVDNTYLRLKALAAADSTVKIVNFARNFGNQIAITAGVEYCRGDLAVIIDDDLQDPPEIILDFLAKWSEGYKVVYGVRPRRKGINPLFKLMAKFYYRIIGALSDTKIPHDTGDFRLIDKVIIDQLRNMKEENRYYRGMVAWVGFPQSGYIYERDRRYAGESNFSFRKYVNFALNGLTSFTDKPLYFSSLVGFFITAIAFLLAIYLVINKVLNPEISIQGWTSLMTIIMFFGGIQLFSIGILGVYISKIYREVKQRPLYIVQDLVNIDGSGTANSAEFCS